MFSRLPHYEVNEDDLYLSVSAVFGDRHAPNNQLSPSTNIYVTVNPDEMDHMLVDPAYRLEKTKEAQEKLVAMMMAYKEIDKQIAPYVNSLAIPVNKTVYENWWKVEKAIRKYDRWFNKIERFDSRAFLDPENHERREKRMQERKSKRWLDNYTYFFGGLTEEEQQYRDYFESDGEVQNEDEKFDEQMDEHQMGLSGNFNFKNFDFQEDQLQFEVTENIDDVIDKKLFKHRYRIANDSERTYYRRMDRVMQRFLERARFRDPAIDQNLQEVYENAGREESIGMSVLKLVEGNFLTESTKTATQPIREYMLKEAELQYRDYYESDEEEQSFFEYFDKMTYRDKIRFIEVFEDYTLNQTDGKKMVSIPKRENNPELSIFANLALDIQDFNERVRPLAKDMALLDKTHKFQREGVHKFEKDLHAVRDINEKADKD